MDKLYVIEECLAPCIWVLLSDRFYMTKSDATNVYLKVCQSMQKYKKGFKARVTELQLDKKRE